MFKSSKKVAFVPYDFWIFFENFKRILNNFNDFSFDFLRKKLEKNSEKNWKNLKK